MVLAYLDEVFKRLREQDGGNPRKQRISGLVMFASQRRELGLWELPRKPPYGDGAIVERGSARDLPKPFARRLARLTLFGFSFDILHFKCLIW